MVLEVNLGLRSTLGGRLSNERDPFPPSVLICPQNISPLTDWPVKVLFLQIPYDSAYVYVFFSTVADLNGFFLPSRTNLFTNKMDMPGFFPRVSIFLCIQERSESFYFHSCVLVLFRDMFRFLSAFFKNYYSFFFRTMFSEANY